MFSKRLQKKFFAIFITFILVANNFPYVLWQSLHLETPSKEVSIAEIKDYVPWEVIVKFKPSKINLKTSGGKSSAQSFAATQNMETTDSITNNNIVVMEIQGTESVEQKIIQLESSSNVEYAEPNYIRHIQSFNDTHTGVLRWLPQISWYQAFAIFTWNTNPDTTWTIVAVIDAGVAYDHPDLINQMRSGGSCKDENWNNLWWCIYGYDFADNDKNPYPVDSDHGTHVAWTIAAEANNNRWILWVNFNAKIMAIKIFDNNGQTTSTNIMKWIDFATQNWAKVINASFGGPGFSQTEYNAVDRFKSAWWLFVAAAGNGTSYWDPSTWDNHDISSQNIYPCDFDLNNIICVAATNASDNLASFSDYWTTSVDVWAPWVGIYSTVANITEITWMFQNFESTATGTIPSGRGTWWVGNNIWWVRDIGWDWWKVLYGDLITPYADNISWTIQTWINTANASGITIDFRAMCDTQYSTSSRIDYMALEVSADGTGFVMIDRRDEAYLDNNSIESDNSDWMTYGHLMYSLTWYYSSANFKIRFRWVTDSSDHNYTWCLIDDVTVKTYKADTSSEPYWYMQWTSMATPHVAWLASLARSMRPELSYQTIKSAILGSGDSLSSLSWKTVSGKRINVYNTLIALWWPITNRAWIYTSIWQTLSGQWIVNNFSTVNNSNVSTFSWLYFASMSWWQELWRITFATWLNLIDTGTQNFLSSDLPSSIWMEQWKIWFTPWTWFAGKNATLTMYLPYIFSGYLASINSGSFVVRTSSGGTITGNSMISSVTYGTCVGTWNFSCPLYINVDHFTQFDLRPQLLQVHIKSNNSNTSYAKSWDIVTLNFTWSESLTWVFTTINWLTGTTTWVWTSRSSTFTVTWWTTQTWIIFSIIYQDLYGNTWTTTTATTDTSSVRVDTASPTLSWAATVSVSNQTASFVFTGSEIWSITYSWACWNGSLASSISWSNTTTFVPGNNTYTWCQLRITDNAGNISSRLTIPTFTINYTAPSGWWGWGWGGTTTTCTLSNLICTDWKYILKAWASCEWGSLNASCTNTSTGDEEEIVKTITKPNGSITGSPFSVELNNAYLYAYDIGITTIPTIQKANITWSLIRAHMAKMMVNYAIKVLNKYPEESSWCVFTDTASQSTEMKNYIKRACQLGLMGIGNTKFNPSNEVTRAEFGTVLSRALYENKYDGWAPYYLNHLNALKDKSIISKTTPSLKEQRGYVMLMLMRAK